MVSYFLIKIEMVSKDAKEPIKVSRCLRVKSDNKVLVHLRLFKSSHGMLNKDKQVDASSDIQATVTPAQ